MRSLNFTKSMLVSAFLIFPIQLFAQARLTNAKELETLLAKITTDQFFQNIDSAQVMEEVSGQLQTMNFNISADIISALPNGAGNVTPEWYELMADVHKSYAPYQAKMVKIALSKPKSRFGYSTTAIFQVLSLLDYARPDAEFDRAVREVIHSSPTPDWTAYRLLFEHRLIEEPDINEMILKGQNITDQKEKIKWAEQLAFYGSDAGLSILENLLKVPFTPDGMDSGSGSGYPSVNESMSSYGPAYKAVDYLGERVVYLRPLIKLREAEVKAAMLPVWGMEKTYPFLAGFGSIYKRISGEIPIETQSAKNGSGILTLYNNKAEAIGVYLKSNLLNSHNLGPRANHHEVSSSQKPQSQSSGTAENSSHKWLWSIGFCGVAIVGILIWRLKLKSTS
jgi:hypothetical protein